MRFNILSMCCINTSFTRTNSWFYGYWLRIINEYPDENSNSIFNVTKRLPLCLKNEHYCLIKNMFLRVLFTDKLKTHCIGNKILRTIVIVANGMPTAI